MTVPNVGTVEDALDVAKVKITKKTVTARPNVGKTALFKDGMFLAKSATKF